MTSFRRAIVGRFAVVVVWTATFVWNSVGTDGAEKTDPAARPAVGKPTASNSSPATKLSAAELARQIDVHVARALEAKKIPASPRSVDAEFLRRVYLDVTGAIPP